MAKLYALPLPELLQQPAAILLALLKTEGHLSGIDQRLVVRIEKALA